MASFQFLVFFFLSHKASTAIICETSPCDGNQNFTVKFPFRLKGSQDRSCGYPGFDLSCDNKNQTILSLPNSSGFVVEHIDYVDQSIYISDPHNCFLRRFMQNFTASVSRSPFQFDYLVNLTFFNCSSNAMYGFGAFGPIDCISGDDYMVLIALTVYAEALPPPATCRATLTDLFPMLEYGIVQLTWGTPGCKGCEARGGESGDCARKNPTSPDVGCFNVPTNGTYVSLFHQIAFARNVCRQT